MNDYMRMPSKLAFLASSIYPWISVITLTSAISMDYSKSNLASVPTSPDAMVLGLDLQHNLIVELGPGSFISYSVLEHLDMSFNPLKIIHDGTFYTLHNLLILTITDAELVKLPSDFGPSTTTLKNINLVDSLNNPDIIKYPYFAAFSSLWYIKISWNEITPPDATILPPTVTFIHFNSLGIYTFPAFGMYSPNAKTISIRQNMLVTIPPEYIEDLTSLQLFNAQDNNITNFPNFSHCLELVHLTMSKNELTNIPREHIMGLLKTKYMDLGDNAINVMPDISNLTTLETFKIGFNQIPEIPHQYITGLVNMKYFDCQNNDIIILPDISELFPQLQELYVQGNLLTILPDLYEMISLGMVYATDNPYVCNQSLCWLRMLSWMRPSVTMLQDDPICEEPHLAAGTRVVRYHPSSMECYKGMNVSVTDICAVLAYIHDDVIKLKTISVLLALCAGNSQVTVEFPAQRPVTRSFDVLFDLHLNKRMSKQSWFGTPSCSLWRHCNV